VEIPTSDFKTTFREYYERKEHLAIFERLMDSEGQTEAEAREISSVTSRLLKAVLRGRRPIRVLDVGCGTGRIARLLAESWSGHGAKGRFDYLDPSAAALAAYEESFRASGLDGWLGQPIHQTIEDFVGGCDCSSRAKAISRCDFPQYDLMLAVHALYSTDVTKYFLDRLEGFLSPSGIAVYLAWSKDSTFAGLREALWSLARGTPFQSTYVEDINRAVREAGSLPACSVGREVMSGGTIPSRFLASTLTMRRLGRNEADLVSWLLNKPIEEIDDVLVSSVMRRGRSFFHFAQEEAVRRTKTTGMVITTGRADMSRPACKLIGEFLLEAVPRESYPPSHRVRRRNKDIVDRPREHFESYLYVVREDAARIFRRFVASRKATGRGMNEFAWSSEEEYGRFIDLRWSLLKAGHAFPNVQALLMTTQVREFLSRYIGLVYGLFLFYDSVTGQQVNPYLVDPKRAVCLCFERANPWASPTQQVFSLMLSYARRKGSMEKLKQIVGEIGLRLDDFVQVAEGKRLGTDMRFPDFLRVVMTGPGEIDIIVSPWSTGLAERALMRQILEVTPKMSRGSSIPRPAFFEFGYQVRALHCGFCLFKYLRQLDVKDDRLIDKAFREVHIVDEHGNPKAAWSFLRSWLSNVVRERGKYDSKLHGAGAALRSPETLRKYIRAGGFREQWAQKLAGTDVPFSEVGDFLLSMDFGRPWILVAIPVRRLGEQVNLDIVFLGMIVKQDCWRRDGWPPAAQATWLERFIRVLGPAATDVMLVRLLEMQARALGAEDAAWAIGHNAMWRIPNAIQRVQLAKKRLRDGETEKATEILDQAAAVLESHLAVAEDLREGLASPPAHWDAADAVARVVTRFNKEGANPRVAFTASGPVVVWGSEEVFCCALDELLANFAKHGRALGASKCRIKLVSDKEQAQAHVDVSQNGRKIPGKLWSSMMLKNPRSRIAHGLARWSNKLAMQGAELRPLENRKGRVTFRISLPLGGSLHA
jgi:SAM-dependent methyltransferase